MQSLFKFHHVSDNIIRINSMLGLTNEFFYLITGSERAVLLDTGYGIGDLKTFVSSLTSLPLTVINTHGHGDHIGGDFWFDEIHICPEDMPMVENFNFDGPDALAKNLLAENGIWAGSDATFAPPRTVPKMIPVHDGEIFDLGGVTLEAITMPGHSPGCVSFLYKEEKILFSGDNCGPQPLIMLPGFGSRKYSSDTLETFYHSLRKLYERRDEFTRILNCHKLGELPISCYLGVMDAVEGVLNGRYPGVPTAVMKGKITGVYSARGLDPENITPETLGFSGDVIFAKDNIR